MKERLVVYVSGKYTASTPEEVQLNINKAVKKGVELAGEGYAPIIPHTNTTGWDKYNPELTWRDYLRIDLAHVRVSDTVYMLDNWKESKGARVEERYARLLKKNIIYERFKSPLPPELPDTGEWDVDGRRL